MVSGPVQKISDETTKPSMKRCRSAESAPPDSRVCSQPPNDSTRDSRRSSEPTIAADQQRAEHDQHRGAVADRVGQVVVEHGHRRRARDQQRHQAQRVGHDVAGAHRQPVAQEHPDGAAEQHGRRRSRAVPIPGITGLL